jgi:hypothetical protein
MDASLMLFLRHGWGIHAVWPGAGVASVTEAAFPAHAAAGRPGAQTMINLSSTALGS